MSSCHWSWSYILPVFISFICINLAYPELSTNKLVVIAIVVILVVSLIWIYKKTGSGQMQEKPAHGKKTHSRLAEKYHNDVEQVSDSDSFVQQYCKEVRIILHVVNDNEHLAAFSKMEPISWKLEGGTESLKYLRFTVNYFGFDRTADYILGEFGGYYTALIQTAAGQECRPKIESAISQFPNVAWIIGVGVAYGHDREIQKLGDVLVSQQIEMMGTIKITKADGVNNRDTREKIAESLSNRFCSQSKIFSNLFACTKDKRRYSKVHPGVILSGSFLIDNKDFKEKLSANAPEAVGGEMEGYVLMKITKERNPRLVEAIIIKGVCDYGDGTKEKSWQLTAALAAVEYAHLRLEETKGLLFQKDKKKAVMKDEKEAVIQQPAQVSYSLQQKNVDMTDGNTSTAQNEQPKEVTEEPKAATEEPKAATEEPKKATEEPKAATEEPKKATEKPKAATEEPKAATEEPKAVTEEPKAVTEEPKAATEEPKAVTEEPKAATEEPKAVTEAATEEPMYTEVCKIIFEQFYTTLQLPPHIEKRINDVEFIIQACNKDELSATAEEMKGIVQVTDNESLMKLYLGSFAGFTCALVGTDQGRNCKDDILDVLEICKKAKTILGIGVCAGFGDAKLGDVIVSTIVEDCYDGRIETDNFRSRGDRTKVSKRLKRLFALHDLSDWNFVCTKDGLRKSNCITGNTQSFPHVMDSKHLHDGIEKNSSQTKGLDMEASILIEIAKEKNLDAIIIKGVSDYADGSKTKIWQYTAAKAAVSYAKSRMEQYTKNSENASCPPLPLSKRENESIPSERSKQHVDSEAENGQKPHQVDQSDGPEKLQLLLQNVDNALTAVINWEELGQKLGIPEWELANIREKSTLKDIKARKRAMLLWWLNNEKDISKWKLAEALRNSGNGNLADEILSKFY